MKFVSCAKTDVGRRRRVNQDAFLVDDDVGLYIVADGMGGHAAGEVAAWEAVEAVHDMVVSDETAIGNFVSNPDSDEFARDICRLLGCSSNRAFWCDKTVCFKYFL